MASLSVEVSQTFFSQDPKKLETREGSPTDTVSITSQYFSQTDSDSVELSEEAVLAASSSESSDSGTGLIRSDGIGLPPTDEPGT